MIRKLFPQLKREHHEPVVYSRVVSDDNKKQLLKMLRIAVRQANEDQRLVAEL